MGHVSQAGILGVEDKRKKTGMVVVVVVARDMKEERWRTSRGTLGVEGGGKERKRKAVVVVVVVVEGGEWGLVAY